MHTARHNIDAVLNLCILESENVDFYYRCPIVELTCVVDGESVVWSCWPCFIKHLHQSSGTTSDYNTHTIPGVCGSCGAVKKKALT